MPVSLLRRLRKPLGAAYARWMYEWENRLCFSATDRVVRPFDWGVEWTAGWQEAELTPHSPDQAEAYLLDLNRIILEDSDRFFSYQTPRDFSLQGHELQFTSPVRSPYPENNRVHALWFPAENTRAAVVVLPHWNARIGQHQALCKGLRRLGIAALRLSLPYHDHRMPAELTRADYAVSANLGRTLDATRQAVIDTRCCLDWLQSQGYERLGIIGTSLGSCYAFLTSAHDERLQVNVFNHCSSYFADVVWTGLSTRHIRRGLEGCITLDRLRAVWAAISPAHYIQRFARWPKKSKFIYTKFDTTFLPELSRQIIEQIQAAGIDGEVTALPCGHYTMGEAPYKFIAGYHICAFIKRWLPR